SWLLDILEQSPDPEPYIPYFPYNLTFDAHERFSRDADAIRRLMHMGRARLALAAATDESCQIAELEPLLIELGYSDDPEMVRIASWQLAYYYHVLHPKGADLGYVELVSGVSEIDLLLLFSRNTEAESPYAAVIYPRDGYFSLSVAQQWVNRIFPEAIRGIPRDDLSPGLADWYQRGYIDYHRDEQNQDTDAIAGVIIGYRSSVPLHPQDFLSSPNHRLRGGQTIG
ncbi:MAG: hypothetical protein F6K03_15165, partial [Kamptonema sp. SIO4C4]|nr:hypothetical protein [Kamptonema sp. SIO4C4]